MHRHGAGILQARTSLTAPRLMRSGRHRVSIASKPLRVPLAKGPPALIALGAREPRALPTRQSVALIAFLGRAVGAALSR